MTKSDRIAVRVTPELRGALAETAEIEDRTMSQIIERSIRAYISARSKAKEDKQNG